MIYKAFLAANTINGFVGYFSDFMANHRTFILKGGPGTGKSTLMKKLSKIAQNNNEDVWEFYCSSDPDSLDGVYFPMRNYVVLDGTAPHALDATVPAINEQIINLLSAVKSDLLLRDENAIKALINAKKEQFGRAYANLQASAALDKPITDAIISDINKPQLKSVVNDIYQNISDTRNSAEEKYFVDSFTPDGLIRLDDGLDSSHYVVSVRGSNKLTGVYAVNLVANRLKADGTPFSAFYTAEHPDLVGQIILGNTLITGVCDFGRYDKLYTVEDVPHFDKNAIYLQNLAIKSLNSARNIHKQIEKYYVAAIDFDILNQIADNISDIIFG